MSATDNILWLKILVNWITKDQTCPEFDQALERLSLENQKLMTRMKDISKSCWTALQVGNPEGKSLPKESPLAVDAKHYDLSLAMAMYLLVAIPGEYSTAQDLIKACEGCGIVKSGEFPILEALS